MSDQRILITGGAGCLGANLLDRWSGSSKNFMVIDNFSTSSPGALAGLGDQVDIVEGSVADQALVDACFDRFQPTHVIHSAASYKDPDNWVEDTDSNVKGSIHVTQAARRLGIKRILNFQTALCYGRPDQVPVPIEHPTRPFTSYGISKTAGEAFMLSSGLPVVSLRLGNVTGPRLSIGPIPTFYTRLKAGKGCFCSATTRDFLDMEDFFSLIDLVLDDNAPTGVFNVSTGDGRSIKDVFDQVVAYLGITLDTPVPILPPGEDDVADMVLDASYTEKVFGWKAKIGFEETIEKMLKWYDVHGVHAVYSHVKKPENQQ
jgi:UDP-glucose 4-epimerase